MSRAFRPAENGELRATAPAFFAAEDAKGNLTVTARNADDGVSFASARIDRGGTLTAAAAAPAADGNGGVAIAHGDVIEQLTSLPDGIEQSFSFASAPSGTGDLHVALAVSGLAFAGQNDRGIRFAAKGASAGIRFGRATWIDANDNRTPVDARFDGNAITLTVPQNLLENTVFPATLDPLVGPEIALTSAISSPGAAALTSDGDLAPYITFSGTNFLVAWSANRYFGPNGVEAEVLATRVTPSGTVLDPIGISIAKVSSGNPPSVACLASDGSNFLVAYDTPSGPLVGVRVSSAGVDLDATGFSIVPYGTAKPSGCAAVFDGTDYLVAWNDSRTSPASVYSIRVATTGAVVGTELAVASSHGAGVDLAFDGTNALVVWNDNRNSGHIEGQLVSTANALVGSNTQLSHATGGGSGTRVLYDAHDAEYFVTWNAGNIFADHISTALASLDTSDVQVTNVASSPSSFSIAYDTGCAGSATSCYFLTFDTTSGPLGTLVHGDGSAVIPAGSRVTPASVTTPANTMMSARSIAFGGNSYLFVFADDTLEKATEIGLNDLDLNNQDVVATHISRTGVIDSAVTPIDVSADQQRRIAVAYNANATTPGYLVVWQEDLHALNDHDIYGVRVDPKGNVLDAAGIAIAARVGSSQMEPAVASDGTNWLVTWIDDVRGPGELFDAYATRVSAAGSVLDTAFNVDATNHSDVTPPGVTFDGAFFVIDHGITGTDSICTVTKAGAPSHCYTGSGVWDAGSDDLGYFTQGIASGGVPDSAGRRVSLVIDSLSFAEYIETASDGSIVTSNVNFRTSNALGAAVTFDGTNYLVTWVDTRGATKDIYGRQISGTFGVGALGTVDFLISGAAGDQTSPAVAFDGVDSYVTWQDARAGAGSLDIYGARVDKTGTVLSADANGFAIATSTDQEYAPAIASDGLGRLLVAYDRFDTQSPFDAARARVRLITGDEPNGTSCGVAGDCANGFCVDGVCCNTACGGGVTTDCQACSTSAGAATNGTCGATTGNACDDENACTTDDVCAAGTCAGTNVTCTAEDACHVAGTCGADAGVCSNPIAPNGTPCAGGACTSGVCVASAIDAGASDAGSGSDGGSSKDAGSGSDASASNDAGNPGGSDASSDNGANPNSDSSGCGCRLEDTRDSNVSPLVALVMALVLAGARRKARANQTT